MFVKPKAKGSFLFAFVLWYDIIIYKFNYKIIHRKVKTDGFNSGN